MVVESFSWRPMGLLNSRPQAASGLHLARGSQLPDWEQIFPLVFNVESDSAFFGSPGLRPTIHGSPPNPALHVRETLGFASHKGSKPRANQDNLSAVASGENILLGVFDGHGPLGEIFSELAARWAPLIFFRELQSLAQGFGIPKGSSRKVTSSEEETVLPATSSSEEDVETLLSADKTLVSAALNATFRGLAKVALQRVADAGKSQVSTLSMSGTTCVLCHGEKIAERGFKVTCAWVGDSRALVVQANKVGGMKLDLEGVKIHLSLETISPMNLRKIYV